MSEQILINVTPQETRVAVIESGAVQELHVERTSARGLVGNIYLGRVARVLPGMQSAFIEIGLSRAAFLHVADIFVERNGQTETRPIERILTEGQALLVQVIKDPIGSKGARLSTQIGIAGRLLVYLPQEHHIGISQRIEDETERAVLREKLTQLLPEGSIGGFIIRTVAEAATERELAFDIEYLRKVWAGIESKATAATPPALLHQDLAQRDRLPLSQRVELGLGGFQVLDGSIVGASGCDALLNQSAQALFRRLCLRKARLGRADIGFGRAQLVLEVLAVESREHLAALDRRTGVDGSRDDLAADAEPDVALEPRPDFPDRLAIVLDGFRIDDDRSHGANFSLRRRRFAAAASKRQERQEAGNEYARRAAEFDEDRHGHPPQPQRHSIAERS